MRAKYKRWLTIFTIGVMSLIVLSVVAYHVALRVLRQQIADALGPRSEVAALEVGWSSVRLRDIRIPAQVNSNWPVADELRAREVRIIPDLRSLFFGQILIQKIQIEAGYLSMLRTRDGRLRVLPTLLSSAISGQDKSLPDIKVGLIQLDNAGLDFFDATVRSTTRGIPHRIRMENVNAQLRSLQLPDLRGRSQIELNASLVGVQRNGSVQIQGWIELATKESDLKSRLQKVDLLAFEPYLLKSAEVGLRRGSLDLSMRAQVQRKQLHAPGVMTLSNLELRSGANSFMGVPRQALLTFMQNNQGQIQVKFTLAGNLDDPRFSLNENIATRMAASLGNVLGISLEGLVQGVGNVLGNIFRK